MARRRSTPATIAARRAERAELKDPGPVLDAAAAFIAVRPRSVAETKRRLKHLGYPEGLVEQVVNQLIELDYLDDEAFARAWVESRDRARPRGEMALRRELALKGVSRQIADQTLAERQEQKGGEEDGELSAAVRLLERRRSNIEREPDANKRRQKAYSLLARNGFDPEICRSATNSWLYPSG